jgi:hypothetical protein
MMDIILMREILGLNRKSVQEMEIVLEEIILIK